MKLLSLASVGSVDQNVLEAVGLSVQTTFRLEIRRLEPLPDPVYAWHEGRDQYDSGSILLQLSKNVPADAHRLLAVTERDLFIPILSFVFGHAQFKGAVALISLARLRQEFYMLPSDPPLLYARAVKEAIHEVGHTMGLVHCSDRICPMSLSTNVRQVDIKSGRFCESCAVLVRESANMLSRQQPSSSRAGGWE